MPTPLLTRRQLLRRLPSATLGATLGATLTSCTPAPTTTSDGRPIIRFGHFPNITHVQALVAHHLWRQKKCWFHDHCQVEIEWFIYNAGPSAIEAVFSRALDLAYIGPSPVLNAYAKSNGSEPRILAGAANGGSALIVHPASGITTPADFRGKRLATPQIGNTQDIQARAWLLDQGFSISQTGGEVHVIPTRNADQLSLFAKGALDAVWTTEPWATRLQLELGGKVFLEDKETTATLLIGRSAWLAQHSDLATKIIAAHRALTSWILAHPAESRQMIKDELKILTSAAPDEAVLDGALARTVLTNDISPASLQHLVASAQKVGFLKSIPALDSLLLHP